MTQDEGGQWLARAETKLAELGPDRAERLQLVLEDAFASKVVLEHLANDEGAEIVARVIDAVADWMDFHHRGGVRSPVEDGAE